MNTQTLLTLNIDYHHTPLGLTAQDIALVHGMGFPVDSMVKYFYDLYSMGFLNQYSSRQDVLNELVTYSPLLSLTENEYELEIFREHLYTNKLSDTEARLNSCTDLNEYAKFKSQYDFIANLIANKGRYMDVLCKVFVNLNNYILSHSQYYIKPINDFSAKTGLPIQFIRVGKISICGGWIVVEFVQGQ